MIARVTIMPKKDVLDPQGKAVSGALHSLGHNQVAEVRVGKVILVTLDDSVSKAEASEQVTAMCESLLANTVIEDYTFELEG